MGQPLSSGSLFVIFHKMLVLVDCHGAPQRAKRVLLKKNIKKIYVPNENCFNISKELVDILFADSLIQDSLFFLLGMNINKEE